MASPTGCETIPRYHIETSWSHRACLMTFDKRWEPDDDHPDASRSRATHCTLAPLGELLSEHLQDNFGELLPHLYFGDVSRHLVQLVLRNNDQRPPAAKSELSDLLWELERAFADGDPQVDELLSVSFLENLPRPTEPGSEIREMLGRTLAAQLRVIG